MTIYLHAGLPRTGTTALQRHVFPKLSTIAYLGKNADNIRIPGQFAPVKEMRDELRRHAEGDAEAMPRLRRILPSVLSLPSTATSNGEGWEQLAELMTKCIDRAAKSLGDVLFSDEALLESAAGRVADLSLGDAVPLEQLHAAGFLGRARLSVVLRDPIEFLSASYYKTMELRRLERFSFDEYIRRQVAIYERKPTASRLFLCSREAPAHFRSLCPSTTIVQYQDLVGSAHALDTLLGTSTGEQPVSLRSVPRENQSWRRPERVAYFLGAPGVPDGISVEAYAATFPETLRKYGLESLLRQSDM